MKKKYLLLSFVIICLIGILSTSTVNSHIAFPPPGACGAPNLSNPSGLQTAGYQTCAIATCHGGQGVQPITAQNLSIQIGTDSNQLTSLDNTFTYTPNQNYYIKFSVLAPGYVWGFELTALNPDTSMAGAFSTDGNNEHLASVYTGGPNYIGHLHANHNTSSWTFIWTAPSTDSAVTFYYAFNAGDSLDYVNDAPDQNIFADTVIILASGAGVQNIANNVSGLQIYPNPIDGAFNLSFDVLKPGNASAMLYSVDGKLCKMLFNENLSGGAFNRSYNIASLAPGIYLVRLNINGATVTKKIVKE